MRSFKWREKNMDQAFLSLKRLASTDFTWSILEYFGLNTLWQPNNGYTEHVNILFCQFPVFSNFTGKIDNINGNLNDTIKNLQTQLEYFLKILIRDCFGYYLF